MTFGLYSRFGTTWGAWAALVTSVGMSGLYIFATRNWADIVYPAIAKMGWVESFDNALRVLSSPFAPYIQWTMDPVKCPVNAIEFNFFLSLLCVIMYVAVSLVTCREPFNLERMLHRGKYSLGERRDIRMKWTPRNILHNIVGITPEYTRGDRIIAWGVCCYSLGYGFLIMFCGTVIWNAISPWPVEWWCWRAVFAAYLMPCVVATVSTVWFGIGGIVGLRQLFRDLKARREVNDLDDGRVDGSMSLADKAALEAVDRQQEHADKD